MFLIFCYVGLYITSYVVKLMFIILLSCLLPWWCFVFVSDCPPPINVVCASSILRPIMTFWNQTPSSSLINNHCLVGLVCRHQKTFDCRYQLKKEARPNNSPYVVVQVCSLFYFMVYFLRWRYSSDCLQLMCKQVQFDVFFTNQLWMPLNSAVARSCLP